MKINYKEISAVNLSADNTEFETLEAVEDIRLVDILLEKFPEGFSHETVVYVNNNEIIVDNFDMNLNENDLVTVSTIPGASIFVMIVINIVIALVVAYLTKPKEPNVSVAGSVYSTNIKQIEAKLGDPVQLQYGRLRQYPKLASKEYIYYSGNKEHHMITTCVGIGNYDIHDIYLNDTNMNQLKSSVKTLQLNTGNKSNINQQLASKFGSNARYIVHDVAEFAGLKMDPGVQSTAPGSTGYSIINANDTKIDKVLINFEFSSGIWSSDSDGDDDDATAAFTIYYQQIDEDDNEIGLPVRQDVSWTLVQKTPFRTTVTKNLVAGRWKVKVARTDWKGSRDQKNGSIKSIVGLDINASTDNIDAFTMLILDVEVGESIATNSALSFNIDTTRRGDAISNYNTLYDFVKDIWTNKDYGMGESMEFLEFRDQLDIPLSLTLDKSEQAFDQLSSTLKSFGYFIFPYLNKYIIKKEQSIPYRSFVYNTLNTKDIGFSYKVPDESELKRGIKVRYLEEGELNFETYSYPNNLFDYDETVLPGVSTKDRAQDMALFLFAKARKQVKTCHITTDLQGIIPEIGAKVGVLREYLKENIAAKGKTLDRFNITVEQKIKFKGLTDYYVIVTTNKNKESNIIKLEQFTNDTFTDTITLQEETGISLEFDEEFQINIGDKVEVMEDYLVNQIMPGAFEADLTKPVEVKLVLKQYVDSIYQEVE